MGEAIKKPTAFEITVNNKDRHVLYVVLTTTLRCPVCKSGPLDTTDPIKFLKFSKVWNAFKLSDFEDLDNKQLVALLTQKETNTVTVETEILRFTIETILSLSQNLNTFPPAIPILDTLINLSKENKIKIGDYEEAETPEVKNLTITDKELKLIVTTLLSPKLCENQFQVDTNRVVTHGAAIDHPKTVKEYSLFARTINQLNLVNVFNGKETLPDFNEEKTFELDTETVKYLHEVVLRRSTSLGLPANKLIKLFNKLEELKK